MTKTKQRERGAHGADDPPKDSLNVREEIQKALEDSEIIDVLVSKFKTILVEELTTVLTKKVGDSLRENFDFELASRDEQITSLEKEVDKLKEQQDEAELYNIQGGTVLFFMA